MQKLKIITVLAIVMLGLQACGPFGNSSTPPKPTSTPIPQFCFGPFVELLTAQIGNTQSKVRVLVNKSCLLQTNIKQSPATTPVASNANVQITQYTNDFTVDFVGTDTPTLDNCSGTTSLSQGFSETIAIETGLSLGNTFYTTAPTLKNNDQDQIAEAVYITFSNNGLMKPATTTYNFTLATPSHTRLTRFITWREHFIAGQANIASGQNQSSPGGFTFAIPTEIDFAGSANPPGFQDFTTSC